MLSLSVTIISFNFFHSHSRDLFEPNQLPPRIILSIKVTPWKRFTILFCITIHKQWNINIWFHHRMCFHYKHHQRQFDITVILIELLSHPLVLFIRFNPFFKLLKTRGVLIDSVLRKSSMNLTSLSLPLNFQLSSPSAHPPLTYANKIVTPI